MKGTQRLASNKTPINKPNPIVEDVNVNEQLDQLKAKLQHAVF
jgi:hypothetical protein